MANDQKEVVRKATEKTQAIIQGLVRDQAELPANQRDGWEAYAAAIDAACETLNRLRNSAGRE